MFQKIAKHRANDASNDVHRPPLVGASMEMKMCSKIFPSLLSGHLPAKAFRGETVRRYVSLSWSSAAVFVEQEEGERGGG